MSFVTPRWDAEQSHYVIDTLESLRAKWVVDINRDNLGSTVFKNVDAVHDVTVEALHMLIKDGDSYKWFTKLPSHEQLMKRVRHSFGSLGNPNNNAASLYTVLMTPKQLTFVWVPTTVAVAKAPEGPALYVDDSESESESEPELAESELPPVSLRNDAQQNQEEYLLTRLRAARARVDAEQIKMHYFETTGRMPPDSDSEEDEEDE
jgi:hypothetical protein